MFIGEIGLYAGQALAETAWSDFINYVEHSAPAFAGYTWWAGGWPQWWPDPKSPHFSVAPTDDNTYTGDTTNMKLIESNF